MLSRSSRVRAGAGARQAVSKHAGMTIGTRHGL